jgi:hypothetical protein
MKTIVLLSMYLLLNVNSVKSQSISKERLQHITQHIAQTLKNDNNEIIGSQLATIIQLASINGVESVQGLKYSIATISFTANDAEIRYKAFLTLESLNNPKILKSLPKYSIEQTESIFSFIQQSINQFAFFKRL